MRRAIYKDGSEYNGTLSNDGLKHGAGSLKFSDGSQYTGQFENGFFHGLGIIVEADGSRYWKITCFERPLPRGNTCLERP